MQDSQFIIINTSEIFVGNPFINNPHLTFIEPYKSLYVRDKSKDKRKASNEMYAIFILCSPDESINKWMKLTDEKKKQIVAEHLKIDWNDSLIKKAIEDYPLKCMGLAERTLKSIQNKLLERDKFMKESPYTMDYYMKDDNGAYVSRGNSFVLSSLPPKEIDSMIKLTTPLYEELSKARKLFAIEKDNIAIRGQRRATDLEDGSLLADYESR